MSTGLCCPASSTAVFPTAAQLRRFLPNGGTIRDVLGWHRVEQAKGVYVMPDYAQKLYAAVAEAGCQNVATLAFGNKLYTPTNMSFVTGQDAQGNAWNATAQFVAYAVWAVKNVPNLAAVLIWNEYNGSFGTGSPPDRISRYGMLLAAVVPAIRAANPAVKIIAGATVGWNIDGWFKNLNGVYSLSNVDCLDIHPYFGTDKVPTFAAQMGRIRAAGIHNPAWYTEHGGPVATKTGANYWSLFNQICAADSVSPAGANYWLLQSTAKFNSGLLDASGVETTIGKAWP